MRVDGERRVEDPGRAAAAMAFASISAEFTFKEMRRHGGESRRGPPDQDRPGGDFGSDQLGNSPLDESRPGASFGDARPDGSFRDQTRQTTRALETTSRGRALDPDRPGASFRNDQPDSSPPKEAKLEAGKGSGEQTDS